MGRMIRKKKKGDQVKNEKKERIVFITFCMISGLNSTCHFYNFHILPPFFSPFFFCLLLFIHSYIDVSTKGFELDDLNVILNSKKLDTIVVPKVQSPSDLQFVDHMINLVASGES